MSRLRVVLADDTPAIRDLLRVELEEDGRVQIVGEAEDGSHAVALVAALSPDAVVLDLAMPRMDGLQAIPEIKRASPASKILILSGFEAAQMEAEAIRLGADAYFEKGEPFSVLAARLVGLCAAAEPPPAPTYVAAATLDAHPVPATNIGETIAAYVHELRTPLTAIIGYADRLSRSAGRLGPDEVRAGADTIARSAAHMSELLRSFVDVGALEIGRLSLRLEQVNPVELVRQILADLRTVTEPHPVTLTTSGDVVVTVDVVRIRQVVTNLVTNAAKFSPSTSPIEIDVRCNDVEVEIAVTDHGPGIAESDMPLLFRKFSRLTASIEGSGLGLYLSRGIARAHGGDIAVTTATGSGSRFALRLPA
jgi:signal transduction histidine kinase